MTNGHVVKTKQTNGWLLSRLGEMVGGLTFYSLWPSPPTTAFASVDSCMLRTRHAPPLLKVFVLRATL